MESLVSCCLLQLMLTHLSSESSFKKLSCTQHSEKHKTPNHQTMPYQLHPPTCGFWHLTPAWTLLGGQRHRQTLLSCTVKSVYSTDYISPQCFAYIWVLLSLIGPKSPRSLTELFEWHKLIGFVSLFCLMCTICLQCIQYVEQKSLRKAHIHRFDITRIDLADSKKHWSCH